MSCASYSLKSKSSSKSRKVFEDIQHLLYPEDIINEVVFDLEDPSSLCSIDHANSLSFFSKFECGNQRKAIHVRSHEYDLTLNAEANCSQHHKWFYFEVWQPTCPIASTSSTVRKPTASSTTRCSRCCTLSERQWRDDSTGSELRLRSASTESTACAAVVSGPSQGVLQPAERV
eukprot:XP_014004325.1 PREDICTED: cytosolic carboxypeptidase 4-like [Salmo salar]